MSLRDVLIGAGITVATVVSCSDEGMDTTAADKFYKSRAIALGIKSNVDVVLVCETSFKQKIMWDKTNNTIYSATETGVNGFKDLQPQAWIMDDYTGVMKNSIDKDVGLGQVKKRAGCMLP